LQLAVSFAAEACAEATRNVNDAGTSAIRPTQPFERYFRDTNTIVHHAANSNRRYVDAARLMLGQESLDFPELLGPRSAIKVRYRRISLVASGRGDGPLSNHRAAGQLAQRERVFMPIADCVLCFGSSRC
jgi:hypothetical protein